MWPLLLRPPVRRSGSRSDFSGVVRVISAKSDTDRNRVPGVTGLNWRMAISPLEDVDRVALFERHDGFFPCRPPTHVAGVGAPLGAHHERPDAGHADAEQGFDRDLDLGFGRVGTHAERVFLARGV